MKKLLLIAAATIVVLGAGVLLVRQDQTNQNTKINTVETEKALAVSGALLQADAAHGAQRAEWVVQMNNLRVECEKGLAVYDSLTTFEKRSFEEPNCGTVTI